MRIAAIIVNYHGADDTLAAAASVLGQTLPCAVTVVDNSANPSEARRLRADLPTAVQLLVAPRNLGFAAACNWAFRESASEYVLLINPDARLFPAALERLAAALDADPQLAAIAPATWWDEQRQWLLPTLLPETMGQWLGNTLALRWPGHLGRWRATRWLRWQQTLHAQQTPRAVDFLSGGVLLLRRRAIDAVGGLFDERFFMFYEDADLCQRLRKAGLRLALLPSAEARHRWRNVAHKTSLMTQSADLYAAKHHPHTARLLRLLQRLAAPERRPEWGIAATQPLTTSHIEEWRQWLGDGRIVSISPSPLGFPAIFRPLGEAAAPATRAVWDALDPGRYLILARYGDREAWCAFEKKKQ